MSLILEDRVRETTTVTGTSDAILLGAVTGFQAFSAIGSGNTTYYTISDQSGGNWEVGLGTYSSVGPTLARTTVLSSSNSGAKVSFPAGTKDVFVTYPSEKAVYLDASGNITPASIGPLTVTSLTDSGLTATRVTYATTGGLLTDDADLTFNGTTLTSGGYSTGGNLTFTGTGNRITGDFSNATVANRVWYQTSTSNTSTIFDVVPNGTGVAARTHYSNTSDPANASIFQVGIQASGSNAILNSTIAGTGTYLPLLMYTGGSERLRIDTSGNVGIGTASPTGRLEVTGGYFAANTGASIAGTGGPSTGASLEITYGAVANTARLLSYDRTGAARKDLLLDGLNLLYNAGGSERMRIDSSGNLLLGGTSTPGAKVMYIANATTVPTSNPTGGGVLYVEGGALKYRGSSGTVTTIANA